MCACMCVCVRAITRTHNLCLLHAPALVGWPSWSERPPRCILQAVPALRDLLVPALRFVRLNPGLTIAAVVAAVGGITVLVTSLVLPAVMFAVGSAVAIMPLLLFGVAVALSIGAASVAIGGAVVGSFLVFGVAAAKPVAVTAAMLGGPLLIGVASAATVGALGAALMRKGEQGAPPPPGPTAPLANDAADPDFDTATEELRYFDQRLLKLQGSPGSWTVTQVGDWLFQAGFERYRTAFAAQDVDGQVLLSLSALAFHVA